LLGFIPSEANFNGLATSACHALQSHRHVVQLLPGSADSRPAKLTLGERLRANQRFGLLLAAIGVVLVTV
jgi:hypothetical protein